MRFSVVVRVLSGSVLFVSLALLTGCGQESDNLTDPTLPVTALCKDAYAEEDCISGRFIADAVENLDYECGKVKAKTEVDGSFVCPINTKVTFLIRNPLADADDTKQIVLGQVDVRKPALQCFSNPNVDCTTFPAGRLYVTPATLTSSSEAQQNMVRMLLVLNRDASGIPTESPAHRIMLSDCKDYPDGTARDCDQKHLDKLVQGISASDFSKPAANPSDPSSYDNSFDKLLEPFLADIGLDVTNMVTAAEAKKILTRAIYATTAGMYTANSVAGALSSATETQLGALGLFGKGTGFSLTGDVWLLTDRKGRTMGYGIYAKKPDSDTLPFLYSNYPVRPMIMQLGGLAPSLVVGVGIPQWPIDGQMKGLSFLMQDVAGDEPVLPSSGRRTLTFYQGVMERGAVAGTKTTFNNLFGNYPDSGTPLGQWQLEDSTTDSNRVGPICPSGFMTTSDPLQLQACAVAGATDSSSYTLVRSAHVSPTLDPELWGNTTNQHSPLMTFPINMKISFKNSGTTPTTEKTWGPIYVSVLADGNIVTNLNYDPSATTPDCNVGIDLDTLVDAIGQQEYPMGTVMNISKTGTDDYIKNEVFFAPLMMIPQQITEQLGLSAESKTMLPYIQLASNTNQQSLVFRYGDKNVGRGSPAKKPFLDAYSVTIDANGDNGCTGTSGCAQFSTLAGWVHSWRLGRKGLAPDSISLPPESTSGTIISEPAPKCYP